MVIKFIQKVFSKKGPYESPTAASRLSSALSMKIVALAGPRGIPSMPGAARLAFQLATDPNAANRDFIKVLEADEGLAARVLRIANSVYYDRGLGTNSIEQAVVVIGTSNLRSLISATTLKDIFPSAHAYRSMLWQHDLGVAIASREMARLTIPGEEEAAFLAGLMHDVGKLLLLQRFGEDYAKILLKACRSNESLTQLEEDTYVVNHTEIGQYIGEQWNFSPDIIAAIRNHHQPFQDMPLSITLLVKAADTVTHALGIGHLNEFTPLKAKAEAEYGKVLAALNISAGQLEQLITTIEEKFERESSQYLTPA